MKYDEYTKEKTIYRFNPVILKDNFGKYVRIEYMQGDERRVNIGYIEEGSNAFKLYLKKSLESSFCSYSPEEIANNSQLTIISLDTVGDSCYSYSYDMWVLKYENMHYFDVEKFSINEKVILSLIDLSVAGVILSVEEQFFIFKLTSGSFEDLCKILNDTPDRLENKNEFKISIDIVNSEMKICTLIKLKEPLKNINVYTNPTISFTDAIQFLLKGNAVHPLIEHSYTKLKYDKKRKVVYNEFDEAINIWTYANIEKWELLED